MNRDKAFEIIHKHIKENPDIIMELIDKYIKENFVDVYDLELGDKAIFRVEEVNPYPKYSYDSGIVRGESNEPVYGLDENWLIWQLNHGLSIMTLEEE